MIFCAVLPDQDDILDNIGRGLDRQKAAAQGMHSEISRQKVGFSVSLVPYAQTFTDKRKPVCRM